MSIASLEALMAALGDETLRDSAFEEDMEKRMEKGEERKALRMVIMDALQAASIKVKAQLISSMGTDKLIPVIKRVAAKVRWTSALVAERMKEALKKVTVVASISSRPPTPVAPEIDLKDQVTTQSKKPESHPPALEDPTTVVIEQLMYEMQHDHDKKVALLEKAHEQRVLAIETRLDQRFSGLEKELKVVVQALTMVKTLVTETTKQQQPSAESSMEASAPTSAMSSLVKVVADLVEAVKAQQQQSAVTLVEKLTGENRDSKVDTNSDDEEDCAKSFNRSSTLKKLATLNNDNRRVFSALYVVKTLLDEEEARTYIKQWKADVEKALKELTGYEVLSPETQRENKERVDVITDILKTMHATNSEMLPYSVKRRSTKVLQKSLDDLLVETTTAFINNDGVNAHDKHRNEILSACKEKLKEKTRKALEQSRKEGGALPSSFLIMEQIIKERSGQRRMGKDKGVFPSSTKTKQSSADFRAMMRAREPPADAPQKPAIPAGKNGFMGWCYRTKSWIFISE